MLLTFIIVCIFAGTMLAAACKDAATMKIPNWISLALIAGFVVVQPSFTTLIGAALGIVLIIRSKFLPIRILTSQIPLAMFKEEKNMPYGLALAAGALLTLPKSPEESYIFGIVGFVRKFSVN